MEWNCLVQRPTINSRPLRQQSVKRLDPALMVRFKGLKGTEAIGRFFRPSDESELNAGDAPPEHAKDISGATEAK